MNTARLAKLRHLILMMLAMHSALTGLLLGSLLCSTIASAQEPIQLDQSCTATLGNQTVQIQPDGSFLIQNVSVARSARGAKLPQLYRVRATCSRDGEAITGQSEFIELDPGQTTLVVDVFPTELDPIPRSIRATASTNQLEFEQTLQLSVTAIFSDGTLQDVTARAKGTTYVSTNPNLLSVDKNGLITSHNQSKSIQVGLVSMLNQGNITGFFVALLPDSNDVDNDGIPNDYEDLFGLNKIFNDANLDRDNDGLTNIQEFNLGTIPNNPDTDGDGIVDGLDANPLVPDENPPEVTITSPANGGSFVEGETITFSVDASDDGLLSNVELSTDTGVFQEFTVSPFETDLVVPIGAASITFNATAIDSKGNTGNAVPVVVNIIPEPPPVVSITSPAPGDIVIEGSTITISVDATDDVAVVSVSFFVDGAVIATDTASPYATPFLVPIGVTQLTIGAAAVDNLGKAGTTADFVVNVIPDPLTTVVGTVVVSENSPVTGATVTTGGLSATTDEDGNFSIAGVPTIAGNLVVDAQAVINGEIFLGSSQTITTNVGGVTDSGAIEVDIDLGELFVMGDDCECILRIDSAGAVSIEITEDEIIAVTGEDDVDFDEAGIAVDRALYFTDRVSDGILKKTVDGTLSLLVSESDIEAVTGLDGEPQALAIGGDGFIYVNDFGSNSVLKVHPVTGEISILVTEDELVAVLPDISDVGAHLEGGIAVDENGIVYTVSNNGVQAIFSIDPNGTPALLASGDPPFDDLDVYITLAPNGDLIVADDANPGLVHRVTSAGTVSTFLSAAELEALTGGAVELEGGIAFDDEGNFYVAEEDSDDIFRFDNALNGTIWVSASDVEAVTGENPDYEGGIFFNTDTDRDGLNDNDEFGLGSNRQVPDTDGDGLRDGFEVDHGFDPLSDGEQTLDLDNDGLNNLAEQSNETNPNEEDTDGDGLFDGDEVTIHGTDPNNADSDGDKLMDGDETNLYSTNPLVFDTDGGGRSDGQELIVDGTDPLNSSDDLATVSLGIALVDENGFTWDITDTSGINDGTDDAFDGGLNLKIKGRHFGLFSDAGLEENGREVVIGPSTVDNLIVNRKIFVPDHDAFARFLEILQNPTNSEITTTLTITTDVGSDGGTQIISTSSGDSAFDTNDDFIITDDSTDGGGDPTIVHAFSGPGAAVEPVSVSASPGVDVISYTFDVTVPAGERIIIMHFSSQNANRTEAADSANNLVDLPLNALSGLSVEELEDIINFVSPDPTTTLTGQVVVSGSSPVTGAAVAAGGLFATTDANGDFTIADVSTTSGNLVVDVEAVINGETFLGSSLLVAANSGGVTDIGAIEVDIRLGQLFVLDDECECILRIDSAGAVSVEITEDEIIAVTGEGDVDLDDAGIAVDRALYFTDRESDGVLKKTVDGTLSLLASESDIEAVTGLDGEPQALAIGDDGFIYVNDFGSNSVLKVHPVTGEISILVAEDELAAALPNNPDVGAHLEGGIVIDENGIVYTVSNNGVQAIFAIDPNGTPTVLASGDPPFDDLDVYITLAPNGDLIVADDANPGLIHRVTSAGTISTFLSAAELEALTGGAVDLEGGIAFDGKGNFYVAEEDSDNIFRFDNALNGMTWVSASDVEAVTGDKPDYEGGIFFNTDTDRDGLNDDDEFALSTNRQVPDTDGDGLRDGFEVDHGFDPVSGGEQTLDLDNDGLDNLAEQTHETNPNDEDSDGDGVFDGDEVTIHGTDPNHADSDGDALTDGDETNVHSTNPLVFDTDGGGRSDGQELIVDGTDPLNSSDDLSTISLGLALIDQNGFAWDITDASVIDDGTDDAFDGGLSLKIKGRHFGLFSDAGLEDNGREVVIGPSIVDNLIVNRKIFVPDNDAFARFLEILQNPTNSEITTTLTITTDVGSDGGTQIISTSSGDSAFDTNDDFIITDDSADGADDPTIVHAFSGPGAAIEPAHVSASPGDDVISYTFDVTIPAGERIIILHFSSQNTNQADALNSANNLVNLLSSALSGLSAGEIQDIINLNIP